MTSSNTDNSTKNDANPEKCLIEALTDIIKQEKEIESSKQELVLQSDFNVEDVFLSLKLRDLKKAMGSAELEILLKAFSLKQDSGIKARNILKRFDLDKDYGLKRDEFTSMISPLQKEYRILLNCRVDDDNDSRTVDVATVSQIVFNYLRLLFMNYAIEIGVLQSNLLSFLLKL